MPRPVLKLKPKRPPDALPCPKCEGWLQYSIQTDQTGCVKCDYIVPIAEPVTVTHIEHRYPESWIKGQLVNNRKNGDGYIITLLGEEFDPNFPERAIHFTNGHDCQAWISWWYAKDIVDPRAR